MIGSALNLGLSLGIGSAFGTAVLTGAGIYLLLRPFHGQQIHRQRSGAQARLLKLLLLRARRTSSFKFFSAFEKHRLRKARSAACGQSMPVLLDVVNLGLLAGLSFDAALELYCTRFPSQLSEVLSEAELLWRLGVDTRHHALLSVAQELKLPTLQYFADAVQEALTFGSPLATVLAEQAQTMRAEQRSQIEEQIERVPVKMLIPLGTLIVPAMLLAILGPLLSSAFATAL